MPEIVRSNSKFSPEAVSLPVNPIITASAKQYSEVPSNFLQFFKDIVSLMEQYQKAFEEENFNRMGQYIVAVNTAIIKYFNNNSSELKDALKDVKKDTEDTIVGFINKKKSESYSVDEVKDKIEEIVDQYKKKIFDLIKVLNVTDKKDKSSNVSNFDLKSKDAAVPFSIESANEILKKREKSFDDAIGKFSVNLGNTIISKFKDILEKINENNLKQIQKNLKNLSAAYDSYFYNILDRVNVTVNQKDTILKILGRALKATGIGIVNAGTYTLSRILKIAFGFGAIKNVLKFWGGKLFGAVKKIIKFGIGLIMVPLKLAFKAVKFAVTTVYKIGKTLVIAVTKTLTTIFSLSNKLFKKVFNFSILSLLKNSFVAFFKSYAGAFFLGYVFGKIWGSILKLAGLSDAQIRNGEYSIKDDVLFPFFTALKKKFDDRVEALNNLFKNKKEEAGNFVEQVKKEITSSPVWKSMTEFVDAVQKFMTSEFMTDVEALIKTVHDLYTDYLGPVISTLWSVISIFVEGYIAEPKIAKRTYIGALVGLKKIAFFAKHIKAKGGLAAIMAGTLAVGAAAILGQGERQNTVKSNDEKFPLNFKISKKYAHFYGYGDEVEDSEYKTVTQRSREVLGRFFEEVDALHGQDNYKEQREKYRLLESTYLELLNEQMTLKDYGEQLNDFIDFYSKNPNTNGNLARSAFANSIIYYNGYPIVPVADFEKMDLDTQVNFLMAVLAERGSQIDSKIKGVQNLVNGGNDLETVLNEIDKQQLRMPEYMSLGTINYERRSLADTKRGGAMNISIQTVAQAKNDLEDRMSNAFIVGRNSVSGINLDINAHSVNSEDNKKLEQQREDLREQRNKITDGVEAINPLYRAAYIRSTGGSSTSIGAINPMYLKPVVKREYEESEENYRQAVAQQNDKTKKQMVGENIKNLVLLLKGIVNVFKTNYIYAFTSHNLYDSLNSTFKASFEANLDKQIEMKFNELANEQTLRDRFVSQNDQLTLENVVALSENIFRKSLDSVVEAFRNDEKESNVMKIIEDLNKDDFKNQQREMISEFLKQKSDAEKTIEEIKDILDMK